MQKEGNVLTIVTAFIQMVHRDLLVPRSRNLSVIDNKKSNGQTDSNHEEESKRHLTLDQEKKCETVVDKEACEGQGEQGNCEENILMLTDLDVGRLCRVPTTHLFRERR